MLFRSPHLYNKNTLPLPAPYPHVPTCKLVTRCLVGCSSINIGNRPQTKKNHFNMQQTPETRIPLELRQPGGISEAFGKRVAVNL